jgi:myo-inositol-1-phosphate synthase
MIVYDSDISLGKYQQINQIRFLYLLDTPSSIFYTSFSLGSNLNFLSYFELLRMSRTDHVKSSPLLLLVAGAKGAVGSTLAIALAVMQKSPESVLPCLTTGKRFAYLGSLQDIYMAGWDTSDSTLLESIASHRVVPEKVYRSRISEFERISAVKAPPSNIDIRTMVEKLGDDIRVFLDQHQGARPVFINLLPACESVDFSACRDLAALYKMADAARIPDLAYTLAAIHNGVPVVNFTPNAVEIPTVIDEAVKHGVPIAGRDGKTGQTYLKVVLASALKARNLLVDGWYSLNILGNDDGANLMNPHRAASKLRNKTDILDEILGYSVGEKYSSPSHKVHIDFYPPRGDAKEAWDAIDIKGLFGLPMSIRLNLQGRDSILAAPIVLDLARWATVLQAAGRVGPVPELAFYFKKAVGEAPPLTFEDQLTSLNRLERECDANVNSQKPKA